MTPRLREWHGCGRYGIWRGQRLFLKDEGQGPAVVLLHGYPTGSYDWHAVWPLLVGSHRLIAPDFIGLGFSSKPKAFDYTIQNHAEAVDALLSDLRLRSVTVVAHDLGVRVAQEMLARREEQGGLPRIERLVLLNGALCAEAYRPRPIQRLLASPLGAWLGPRIPRRAFERAMRELFGAATPPSKALLEDFWTLVGLGGGRRITHAVGRFWLPHLALRDRLVGALQRSRVPLLLINGAADPNSGQHMVARWLELEPRTEVVSLPAIGHWPQIEAPERTSQLILQHLGTG